jgi:cathepsin B
MKIAALTLALANAGEIQDMVAKINAANTTWTAADPGRFGSFDDVKQLLGTFVKGHPQYKAANLPVYEDSNPVNVSALADSLDLRTAHPECPVIATIRDQSSCGSCWAFGSVETFEDRRCIATKKSVQFSPLDVGTNSHAGNGCSGGQPSQALQWMARTGVVTGGDYGDDNTGKSCQPYGFAPCAHHVPATAKYPACPKGEYHMKASSSCTDSKFSGSYSSDKQKGQQASSVRSVAGAMQALATGTLSVAFTVYADFETYKSGVYKHTSGQALGGHAVAFIGYGTENGQDYWLVKNSWNEEWGDGGTFKIARGSNECGIEDEMAMISFGSSPGPGPAPGPSSAYKCELLKGQCVADPSGKFSSQSDCEKACI